MGRKQHGQMKRKRKTIDLNALNKKQRKIYRESGRTRQPNKAGDEKYEDNKTEEEEEGITEEEVDVSSDEETNPYQQLVATFTSKPSNATDSESEEEEDTEDSDEEQQTEIEGKSKYLRKTNENGLESSDIESGDEFHSNLDDNDDDDDDDDDDSLKDEKEESGTDHITDDEGDTKDEDVDINDDTSEEEFEVLNTEEDFNDFSLTDEDPFIAHFEKDLDEKDVAELTSSTTCKREDVKIPGIGGARYTWSCDRQKSRITHRKDKDLVKLHVKESLCKTLMTIHADDKQNPDGLNPFQHGLFSIMNNYQDILYTERTSSNGEDIRLVYCLHALNHVLKTRRRVIVNNTKIRKRQNSTEDIDYRDQGLTRPKVLMVLPFRESAQRVVSTLIHLLGQTEKNLVDNKKRFFEEYGLDPDEKPRNTRKPEDFQELFAGNCDDHFRIGLGISKKTMKLYSQFYKADIILASPLGLRTLIKTERERDRDYDFLSSIEVLIIDQSDVLMMQNWEHVLHLMDHLHLQPKDSHGVDFSRVRMWTLNGWSKYYRQTLVFSSYSIPEVNALFNKQCNNYTGKYTCIRQPSSGTICQVAVQVPQVFHRVDCTSYADMPDDRFNFFIKKILPTHFDSLMAQTLIYIPSYFDFIRLRNHFTREEIKYSVVNEYASDKRISTARNLFFQKLVPFMMYTERFHFFKRANITGIRHIIFYGLPQCPHFYSEMCNMIQTNSGKSKGDNYTCTVIYTKYEAQKLAEIVGSDRAGKMLHSHKSVHMFVTGENQD